MVSSYRVAWWNLENLFDERDAPDRSDKLQRAIGRDLAGWTRERRDTKIAQLASAIARMGDGAGPDLLGVCEVENERVLGLLRDRLAAALPDRSYAVVHADTSDQRGIDVAFVYDTAYFTAGEHFPARRHAPDRHSGDPPGQLPHAPRPAVGAVRQPLALAQRRGGGDGRVPRHRG